MKIPQILATQDVGVAQYAQQPYGSPDQAAAPYAALAAGGANINRAGQQVAASSEGLAVHIANVERQKRDQGIKIETSALQSQMELEAGTAIKGLSLVETDPDGYRTKAQQAMQDAYANAVNQAKYPETKLLLGQHYNTIRKTKGLEAEEYSNDLYRSRNEGLLHTNLATLRIQGSVAPEYGGPGQKSAVDYYTDGERAIKQAMPLLGEKKAADMLIKWQSDFAVSRGQAELRANPDSDITRFQPFMTPEQYQGLATHQDVLKRAVIAEADKRERKMHQQLDEDRKAITDEYDSRAMRGDLTLPELERAREARMVVGEDYRRIYKQLTEEKDVPDMPAVADRLIMGSHGTRPTVTEREVQNARAAGQISLKTAASVLDRLRTTANMNREQGESQVKRDHEQAEQILRAALGIKPGIVAEQLKEDPAGRLYFSGLDELTHRSSLYKGKENPLTAMDEMAPRYNRALTQNNNNRTAEITLSLRYPTPQALEQAKKAGQITQGAYMVELRKFDEIDRLLKPLPTPSKSGATPTSGRLEYKPGG